MCRSQWIVVGISGVTNGGKTSLTEKLNKALPDAITMNQDVYFYLDDDPRHIKCPTIDHNDYDRLSALDMERMHKDILSVLSLKVTPEKKRVLIIEGFLLFNYPPIYDLFDLKYYIYLDKEESIRRRSTRVYEPADVPGYFEEVVWPSYLKYSAELDKKTDIVRLNGKVDHFETVFKDVMKLNAV